MLRLTGVIALLAAALLSTLIFTQVHFMRAKGRVSYEPGGTAPRQLCIDLTTAAFSRNDSETAVYPSSLRADLFEPYRPLDPAIPNGAKLMVNLWWVRFLDERYTCMEIEYGGKTYATDVSKRSFFLCLALLGASPLLLWAMVAIPALLLRIRKAKGNGE